MSVKLNSESRRLYSWWWDSHISPKNSKWLQENLTDMDTKVKAMIKLIEEDADSFAKRAEMYYRKRPDLMKLVEEFYRAYRALAERYNQSTRELRQAHQTMEKAFPNHVPFLSDENSPAKSSEPHTPEFQHPIRAFFDPDDLQNDSLGLSASDVHHFWKAGLSTGDSDSEKLKSELKKLHEMFEAANKLPQSAASADENTNKDPRQGYEQKDQSLHDELSQLLTENQDLKEKILSESQRFGEAECQVQNLEESLAKIRNEKDYVLLQYQQCLGKLSDLERELSHAQEDAMRLNEKASSAETDVQTLKESLINLEAEKDASINMHEDSLRRIYFLEVKAAQAQENVDGLSERAATAENESEHLKTVISQLKSEKEAALQQYDHCLKKICELENNILAAEENAKFFKEQADRAKNEVMRHREALAALGEEKEETALQYKHCLEKVATLEEELSRTRDDVARLNTEVLEGDAKLKNAKEKCVMLEMSNQTLRQEADNLLRRITSKDHELTVKQEELDNLQIRVHNEHLRYAQIEVTLHTLQNLHSESQDDQRALALELKNGVQMLKDVETFKHSLKDELQHVREENYFLNQQKLSSTITMESMENEICNLRGMKERLEEEVSLQMKRTTSLQQEIFSLQEEIKGLNGSYQSLVVQVESVGLKPDELGSEIEHLQEENLKLRVTCEQNNLDKEDLSEKMGELVKKNAILESSLTAVNTELESTHENMRSLQASCQSLCGEKSSLVAEKAVILSQLQIVTENMQKLLEKNAVLENSLSGAKVELEGLREKSKGLEEICQLLKSEKVSIISERSTLAVQLENIERRLEYLEKRFTGLEEKCAGLEKEKNTVHSQVEELRFSLSLEKQEKTSCMLQNQSRFMSLENNIHLLQEENQWRKKQFEEELDKAEKSRFEIYVLQKFIKDMEEKNYALLVECQKHVEASNLAEQLISELESENLEQQMEAELLLDEVKKLRLDIYQMYQALETGSVRVLKNKAVDEHYFVPHILKDIREIKLGLSESEDNHHKLVVENSVLLSLLDQLKLDGLEVQSQKSSLKQEVETMTEKLEILQNDKYEFQEMNRLLQLEVSRGIQKASEMQSALDNLLGEQGALQEAHVGFQKRYSQVLEENRSLLEKLSSFTKENGLLVQEKDLYLVETLNLVSISTFWKSIGEEMKTGLNLVSEDLHNLQGANIDLKSEISIVTGRLEMKEAENQLWKDSVERLEMELQGTGESNCNLMHEISCGKDFLGQKEAELVETEKRVETAENLNSELCKTVDELENECQESAQMMEMMEKQIMELSEQNITQNSEIESLCERNRVLNYEVDTLREEIQEQISREEHLTSKLEVKNNETELWESEASTFYFDLQLSSICEVLYENKVHELSGLCEIVEDESASKSVEIEQLKETISSLRGEVGGLKSEIDVYECHIASLVDVVACLEMNAFHQLKFDAAEHSEEKSPQSAVDPHDSYCEKGRQSNLPNGIQHLKRLQTRIKEIEKVVLQEMQQHMSWESPKSSKPISEAATNEIEELSHCNFYERNKKQNGKSCHDKEHGQNIKPRKARLRASEGIQMKDIPLDRISSKSKYRIRRRNNLEAGGTDDLMLEIWETSEDCCAVKSFEKPARRSTETKKVYGQFDNVKQRSRHPSAELEMEREFGIDKLTISTSPPVNNQEANNRKILERLASDAEKLADLQITVQSLKRKLDTNKRTSKSKDFDFETVKEQLLEVEETVVQMAGLNGQLMKSTEEGSPSSGRKTSGELKDTLISIRLKKISDQARKGSEKIGRLQLEVQKIQYMLLKLEEEKKSKGKSRFSRSKTTIIFKDFIYNRKKWGSGKRNKSHLCGCFSRPSSSRDGHHISCSSPH